MSGESSRLIVIGLSHLSAPVAVREGLAVPASALPGALAELRAGLGLSEAVLLSTCSRFELYAEAADPGAATERVAEWFKRRCGPVVGPHLYAKSGRSAVEHLFRVAAGLDSWILGETEILGQVKSAYEAAAKAGGTARTLNILFQKALNAGKEVRTRTPIAQGVTSVGGAAALLTKKIFGESGARSVVVFGAGTMAESATRHLMAKGVCTVTVANRTLEKAVELAGALGGAATDFESGLALLATADVAIFSTASASAVLGRDRLQDLLKLRRGRPLFLIDIGVPRNVEPAAAALDGVYLYDIDDLKRMVERISENRKVAVEEAGRLCAELVGACWAKLTQTALGRIEAAITPLAAGSGIH